MAKLRTYEISIDGKYKGNVSAKDNAEAKRNARSKYGLKNMKGLTAKMK